MIDNGTEAEICSRCLGAETILVDHVAWIPCPNCKSDVDHDDDCVCFTCLNTPLPYKD